MSHYDAQPPSAQSIASAVEEIEKLIGRNARLNVAVSGMTSFRVGGDAALEIVAESEDELASMGPILHEHGIPVLVVGRGSNILVSDHGFSGAVLRLSRRFDHIDGSDLVVRCGGSTSFPRVANWAARRSLSGLQFAVAIPASVGGAVRMNAGAHGHSVSDVLASARIVDLDQGSVEESSRSDLDFAYRYSSIGWDQVVVSAEFRLTAGVSSEILKEMESHREHRARTQPSEAPNAGSMFKNPPDRSAGGLIESCGLKGFRVGGAEVSSKHANFFLAHPGGRAQDVLDLMLKVQSTVLARSGQLLVPEVEIVGAFQNIEELRWE